MMPLLWLATVTAGVWICAAWHDREARPIAWGLSLVVLIEIVRLAPLPAEADIGLWLLHPCVSAWCVRRCLR